MHSLDILAAQLLNPTANRPLTPGSSDSLPTRTWWEEVSMGSRRERSLSVSNMAVVM